MLKKTSFYIFQLILGIALVSSSLFFKNEEYKTIQGVILGIGAGLFGMSISNLYTKNFEKKNPQIVRQQQIEANDERRIVISNKAKAKAGDIIKWFIIGIAYVMILIDAPLWATLLTVLVFILYGILSIYYMTKYEKEM